MKGAALVKETEKKKKKSRQQDERICVLIPSHGRGYTTDTTVAARDKDTDVSVSPWTM